MTSAFMVSEDPAQSITMRGFPAPLVPTGPGGQDSPPKPVAERGESTTYLPEARQAEPTACMRRQHEEGKGERGRVRPVACAEAPWCRRGRSETARRDPRPGPS